MMLRRPWIAPLSRRQAARASYIEQWVLDVCAETGELTHDEAWLVRWSAAEAWENEARRFVQ